jgi:hypothetical protein
MTSKAYSMNDGRRFDDKLYKKNARFWAYLDIPGGVWLTLFSGSLLAMDWILFVRNLHLPSDQRLALPGGFEATYIAILSAFAASNIARWYNAIKDRISGRASGSDSSQES